MEMLQTMVHGFVMHGMEPPTQITLPNDTFLKLVGDVELRTYGGRLTDMKNDLSIRFYGYELNVEREP